MIKYLIFDLDDTLLDFQKSEVVSVQQLLKRYGVTDLTQGVTTYQTINQHVWQQIEAGAQRQPLFDHRFTETFATFGIDVDGVQAERQYRELLNHQFYTLPGAEHLLSDLYKNNFTLLVGTNGVKQTQLNRLAGSGLAKYFTDCFISEDIGYAKPGAAFFTPIFAKFDELTSDNTMMIGDSLQSDILGATRVGLKSIWYNPQALPNTLNVQPTYTVNNYQQIRQILL